MQTEHTESCRVVRGAWEVCIEYLHELCPERMNQLHFSRLHRHATVILQECFIRMFDWHRFTVAVKWIDISE